jgi:hypothetical protein
MIYDYVFYISYTDGYWEIDFERDGRFEVERDDGSLLVTLLQACSWALWVLAAKLFIVLKRALFWKIYSAGGIIVFPY